MSNSLLNDSIVLGLPFGVGTFYRNTMFEAVSGRKQVFNHSTLDRKRLDIVSDTLTHAQRDTLLDFINDHVGRSDTFLFEDPGDNFVSRRTIGVGDGSNTIFQLSGHGDVQRKNIQSAPIDEDVWKNGALQTRTTHYNLTYVDDGRAIFVGAPAFGDVIESEFYYYRRFRFLEETITYVQRRWNDVVFSFTIEEEVV